MHICQKYRCKPDEAVTDPSPPFASVLPDVQLICSLAGHVNGQQPKLGDRGKQYAATALGCSLKGKVVK